MAIVFYREKLRTSVRSQLVLDSPPAPAHSAPLKVPMTKTLTSHSVHTAAEKIVQGSVHRPLRYELDVSALLSDLFVVRHHDT